MSHLFTNYVQHDREMFMSAYNTIHRLEAWETLKEHVVDPNKGFTMDTKPEILEIMDAIQKDYDYNHSGTSMVLTMRIMHSIAINDHYK